MIEEGDRDNPLTGVFACRSPARPNLIALTLCRVLSVKGGVVEVDRIDACAGAAAPPRSHTTCRPASFTAPLW